MGQTKDDYSNDNYSVIGDEDEEEFLDFECENPVFSDGCPAAISAPFPFVKGQPQSVMVGATKTECITIVNTTESPLELWRIRIRSAIPDGSYTLSLTKPPSSQVDADVAENSGYLECQSLEDRVLQPRQTLKIWLTCKPKEIGLHHAILNFDVEDDRIERLVFLLADDNYSLALVSNKPFSRRGKKKEHFSYERFVKAPNVPRAKPAPPSRFFLPEFPIPQNLRELIVDKKVPSAVIDKLTYENYVDFFSQLLMVEEIHLEEEMRQYDLECVTMKKKGNYITLQVPGLAEKRPSLVSGDFVYVKMIDDPVDGSLPFQGSIHRVEADEVFLTFATDFHRAHGDEIMYNVTFAYNRVTMRRRYQAVSAAKKGLDPEFLFPSDLGRVINISNFVYINRNLNEEQMTSVAMILGCKGAPPYVIHGPPGTGKTLTIVEAILQLYKSNRSRRGVNILVCAASNSAADHVLDKLMAFVKETEIFRLNASSRSYGDVQPEILRYCYLDEMVFKCPPLSALLRYKIIISTYMSASLLYTEGIRRGHFTHIFLDEVGQASEPEAMIPLANLCLKETVVVLAGDPMQLGPVIYSKEADGLGLGKSYLERLFDFQHYYSGNENFVTKLVRNYRCHPSILKLPSEIFYKGHLMACKEERDLPLSNWRVLPLKDFPVLFCGIQGCDEREGCNPSWFNRIEASKVVEMIRKLTEIPDLVEEDIGVITPYRQQVLKIKKALESLGLDGVKVGSVEQFQGQERRVIIISTVRSTVKHNEHDSRHCLGFLTNPRRFNVAITRAKSLLIVVGNPHIITTDHHWGLFVNYCMENDSYIGCSFTPPVSNASGNTDGIETLSGGSVGESKQENGDSTNPNAVESDVTRSDDWECASTGVDIYSGKGNFGQRVCDGVDDINSGKGSFGQRHCNGVDDISSGKGSFGQKPSYGVYAISSGKGSFGQRSSYGVDDISSGKGSFDQRPSYRGDDISSGKGSFGQRPSYGVDDISSGKRSFGQRPSDGVDDISSGKGSFGQRPWYGVDDISSGNGSFGQRPSYGVDDISSGNGSFGQRPWKGVDDISSGNGSFGQRPSYGVDDISSYMTKNLVLNEKADMPVVSTMFDMEERAWNEKSEGAGLWENNANSEVKDSGTMPWQVKIPEPCFDESQWGDGWN